MLAAGLLRERVMVEEAVDAQDTTGGVVQSWQELAVESMRFEPLFGREPLVKGEVAAFGQVRFTRRFRRDRILSPKTHRLVYNHRVYDIKGVMDTAARETVEIIAEARAE